MAVSDGRFALSYGDVSAVSVWGDAAPVSQPADLRKSHWEEWHSDLCQQDALWPFVGGIEVIEQYKLMFIPPQSWHEKINRGPSIGWPIYLNGEPVNVVRRFLDDKNPRYAGLPGRGVQIWPDIGTMNGHVDEVLLVTGMRDAACCIAAGFTTFTTTAGVDSWIRSDNKALCPDNWGPGRRFSICFDVGEEWWAEQLADYLVDVGSKSVRVLMLKNLLGSRAAQGIKDLADIAEAESIRKLRRVIRLGRTTTGTWE